jgi:hypothetical protein
MSDGDQTITTDVFHCARCGENHEALVFQKFTRPMVDEDSTVWKHWAMCPVLHEPILLSAIVVPVHLLP